MASDVICLVIQVSRESVMWKTGLQHTNTSESETPEHHSPVAREKIGKVSEKVLTKLIVTTDRSWK